MEKENDELKECLEKVDVEQFTKYVFRHHKDKYFNWLCLSYKAKMKTLCELIMQKPYIDEKAKNKAKELMKVR